MQSIACRRDLGLALRCYLRTMQLLGLAQALLSGCFFSFSSILGSLTAALLFLPPFLLGGLGFFRRDAPAPPLFVTRSLACLAGCS